MADFELDDKHFVNAGIDLTEDAGGDTNADQQQVSQPGADTQSGGSESTAATSQVNTLQGGAGKDSIVSTPNGGTQQGKEKQGQGTADPELKAGDIRLQDGSIVRAGAERRHYENARILKTETIDLKNQVNTATQKYNTLQEKYATLESTVKSIGFEDPQRVTAAVRLYKDLSADPVQTVTKLLAELKAKGHTFDGIGGAVDTLAIQSAIEGLKPQQTTQPTPQQIAQQAEEEAAQEATEFLTQFPDAKMHEDAISSILQAEYAAGREPQLREVYYKLRQSVVAQGFDWNSPLGPQIAARKTAEANPNPKPLTQGRGTVVTQHSDHIDPLKSGTAETKDSIILAAMADGGYTHTR